MTRPGDAPVTVPLWAVLYAIRYGMGRRTYAHSDAARLVIEHADALRAAGWADTILSDIDTAREDGDPVLWARAQRAIEGERATDKLDLIGPYRGSCGLCGHPDARHRVYDAIRERLAAGESVEGVAADYLMTVAVVQQIRGE